MSGLQRAVCPVNRYIASQWAGWAIESTETVVAPEGLYARGDSKAGLKGASLGLSWQVHHLVRRAS